MTESAPAAGAPSPFPSSSQRSALAGAPGPILRVTRVVLAHKRLVVCFWVVLTLVGMASAGSATKALKQKFSVPGKEGWVTNQQIAHNFRGTGGNSAPLLAVVTLPPGPSATSRTVQAGLRGVEARLQRALPGTRMAGFAGPDSKTFLSPDGRTTVIVAYPPPH